MNGYENLKNEVIPSLISDRNEWHISDPDLTMQGVQPRFDLPFFSRHTRTSTSRAQHSQDRVSIREDTNEPTDPSRVLF